MGVMVREIYEAFLEAGASQTSAASAAEAVPDRGGVAIQEDIANVRRDIAELRADMAARETRLVKWGVGLVSLAVVAEGFLDWIIR